MAPTEAKPHVVAFDGARVTVPPGAVTGPVSVGISDLIGAQVPTLDAGMTNVTGTPRGGFRFTPHPMRFASDVELTLPYDPKLLPTGTTANDVYTYFYDDVALCWKSLQRKSVDEKNHTVTSLTDHFTDFINTTVAAPDSPDSVSFNPNQIKGISAADPSTGVTLMSPPTANSQGTNNLSYPVSVPEGRNGTQPSIAVSYNSAAENGWLGVGWELTTPAIVVDTRWGVPRYDSGKETETYLLNGAELTPLANRAPAVPRSTGDKVFHTRIESGFAKIVRKGSTPKTYTWEVTDKSGTVYTYGTNEADLKDDDGNIFQWGLLKVTDLHGNFVRYHYTLVNDAGVDDDGTDGTPPLMGRNLYPSSITWTGSGTTEGKYSIVFTRDRQIAGEPLRSDKIIDARGGFKQVTADLLRKIEVKFNTTLIRRYELEYTTGAFDKTLLARIKQFDAAGAPVGTPTEFSYFDEVRDGQNYQGFSPAAWSVPADDLSSTALNLTGQHAGNASALGATSSSSNGGHFYVGSSDLAHKGQSIGVSTGFDHTSSDGVLALLDVDGDNLPDKVFRKDNAVFYRKNLAKPGGPLAFSDTAIKLDTLGDSFSSEHSDSLTLGVDKFFDTGSAQLDYVNTFATTDRYFLDVNDDGILDMVNGTSVLFGRIGPDGPVYGVADATPVPITQGTVDTGKLFGDFSTDQTRFDQSSPLLDTVIRWVAPFTGTIRVTGSAQLDPNTLVDRLASKTADGVKITIGTDTSTRVSDVIGKTESSAHFEDSSPFGVTRGEAVYIRVSSDSGLSSLADGSLDAVIWNDLQIAYTDDPGPDVNNLSQAVYKFADDFTLSGRTIKTPAPLAGTMHLDGDFALTGPVSDDVTVQITRDGTPVLEKTIPAGSADAVPVDLDLDVTAGQKLAWNVVTDSPIDIHKISWAPRAFYTAADGVDPDKINIAPGHPRIVLNPPVNIDMYPLDNLATPQTPWVEPALTGGGGKFNDIVITPAFGFSGGAHPSGQIVFTVKQQPGKLVGKETFTVSNGEVTSSTGPISFRSTVPGEQYYLDFSTRDPSMFLGFTGNVAITVNGVQNTSGIVFDQHSPAFESAFQQPYRGWTSFGYNPAAGPLTAANLVIDDSYDDTLPTDVDPATQLDAFKNNPTITPPRKVVPFYPQTTDGRWGAGPNSWVAATGMSSSRLGAPSLAVPTTDGMNGAVAVPRISRSDTISATGQVLPEGGSLGGSVGLGSSSSLVDYLDLNGDGFPDVIGSGGIQYTDPTGGLGSGAFGGKFLGVLPDGGTRSSTDISGNAGAGSAARTIQTGLGKAAPDGQGAARTARAGGSLPPLGVGGTLSGSTSNENFDLIDINGDGLPDRVYDNGEVELNLGYKFSSIRESWTGAGKINDGSGIGAGLKLGFNTDFYGIAGGGSFEHNLSSTSATLADVNGDGLVDRVLAGQDDSHPIQVSFNTGKGFAPAVDFGGGFSGVAADRNANTGENGFFEFPVPCQPIPTVPGCWIVFNASAGATHTDGLGRTELALRDINGDGLLDDLASTADDSMSVLLNTTGKTNLLKGVTLPLGAVGSRATMAFDYSRDGDTYDMPQSRFVLSRVSVDDKRPGDGQDVQQATYEYSGGVYDRAERQFRGYAQVVTRQRDAGDNGGVLRSTTARYRTDSYYTAGLPTTTFVTDAAGHKFDETENTYAVRNVDNPGGAVDLASRTATLFPFVRRVDIRAFEGQDSPGKTTYTTMDYDAVGNLIDSFDAGDAGSGDDVDTKVSYTATDPSCQATGLTGAADAIDVFGGGSLMRHRESTVDCATGDVTQVRAKLANGDVATTDMTYFASGNLHTVTDPANNTGQRMAVTYGYDPDVDTYVASILDSFGLTSTSTYDPKFGAVLTSTDENNQKITYSYDNAGRLSTVTSPYEQGSSNVTIRFEYHPDAPTPYAVTKHFDREVLFTTSDTIDTITFVDGLGKVIETKLDAAVSTGPGNAPENDMIVSGRVDRDALGRAVKTFYPITEPKGAANTTLNPAFTAAAFDSVQPTVTAYDVLDRPTRITLPDGTFSTMSYGFGADRAGRQQFETTATDANGHSTRSYTDVRGQTVALKQVNPSGGQNVIWTSFGYDPLGQKTSITDDKTNVTTMAYDDFGRQTSVTDPDSGPTDYTYDLAGNLIKKHVAKLAANQFITYDYDFTRLKDIRYPIFTANNVTYTYGGPGAANNAAGRITHIVDAAGSVDRKYGPLGEVTSETRTTTGPANKPVSFTTGYQYDAFNRLLSLTYPDGEVLRYSYDSGGRVNTALGDKQGIRYTYLLNLYYDKFGQQVQVNRRNGVQTQYTYDSQNRRLTNLKTSLNASVANGYVFQNLAYTYDNVGNVKSITNNTAPPPGPAVGAQVGGPSTQTFSYDDLNRLTHAQGSYTPTGKTDTYTQDLTYDSISNITSKNQNHTIISNGQTTVDAKLTYNNAYTYNTAGKPHAASTVGVFTFQYDADGDQISRAQQSGPRQELIWDEDNRIACDHENDSTNTPLPQTPSSCDKAQTPDATFLYDDRGNRVVKQGSQLHIYPNQFYSTVDKFEYKHVYIGTTHLLTKLRVDGKLESQEFWTHTDNIGSTSFITTAGTFNQNQQNFDGQLAQHTDYIPGGETWVNENPVQPIPQQYTGKELDPETNLYYYGARYYNPQFQQFQSPDPALPTNATDTTSLSTYLYARGNPLTYTDPDGRWPSWRSIVEAAAIGVVGALAVTAVVVFAPVAIGAAVAAVASAETAAAVVVETEIVIAAATLALTVHSVANDTSIGLTHRDLNGNKYTDDEALLHSIAALAGTVTGVAYGTLGKPGKGSSQDHRGRFGSRNRTGGGNDDSTGGRSTDFGERWHPGPPTNKWQSIAKDISEGHAWKDHALAGDFGPIDSQEHFAQLIYNVMLNAVRNGNAKPLRDGNRYAYWYQNVLVVYDADRVDSGSAYSASKKEFSDLR